MTADCDKELAKILLDMSKQCETRPNLAFHLRKAADGIWKGDGYSSNGSNRVEEHLRAFAAQMEST